MLEFLILDRIKNKEIHYDTTRYDRKKILKRWVELKKEFLEKYTLDNPNTPMQSRLPELIFQFQYIG